MGMTVTTDAAKQHGVSRMCARDEDLRRGRSTWISGKDGHGASVSRPTTGELVFSRHKCVFCQESTTENGATHLNSLEKLSTEAGGIRMGAPVPSLLLAMIEVDLGR